MTIEEAKGLSINEFDLSVRLANVFNNLNLSTVYDAAKIPVDQLLKYRNFSHRTAIVWTDVLKAHGLHPGMRDDEYEHKDLSFKELVGRIEKHLSCIANELFLIRTSKCIDNRSMMSKQDGIEPMVIRRKQAAEMCGISLRLFDQFCRRGMIKRVYYTGNNRSSGVLKSSLDEFLSKMGVSYGSR